MQKIDVIISVCGKPLQTHLALLSLEQSCGKHIDKIYFIEENTKTRDIDPGSNERILELLKHKIVHFMPKQWNYCFPIEWDRMDDTDYRHSLRYQYGWEMSDKDYVLIIHNDAIFYSGVVGPMLEAIGENVAVVHIGQCWYCPASFAGLCSPDSYMDYRPDYEELRHLYKTLEPPEGSMKRGLPRAAHASAAARPALAPARVPGQRVVLPGEHEDRPQVDYAAGIGHAVRSLHQRG